ncbi:unnamed protein product, partial [Gongylonema pulchrum]
MHFPYLPVIQIGPRSRKIFVPMELLTVAAKPQKVKRELDESQKAKLIRGAAMEPKLRKERIELILNDQDLDN